MSIELETAKQLVKLARRYAAKGEMAESAHALAQAEEIVTQLAKRQARDEPQN